MEETPHMITHFMAVGAEKRLEDYHFLRSTYDTISSQEVQLNRILRMMGEEEITLTWRNDFLPIGRSRNRFPYDFDRSGNTFVLQGSIAYERLRDLDSTNPRHVRAMTPSITPRRSHEFRDRRRHMSEQRDSGNSSSGGQSASRLRALAEFDEAMAESEAKRQKQAEENRLNRKNNTEDLEGVERRRRQITDDSNQTDQKKQKESESRSNEANNSNFINSSKTSAEKHSNDYGNESKNVLEENKNREEMPNVEFGRLSVRCNPVPTSIRLKNDGEKLVRLSCKWSPTSSSSPIDFFTIEQELDNGVWTKVGENVQTNQNQTQLDLSLSANDGLKGRDSSKFRLTAHFKNGQKVSSQPTDEISLKLADESSVVVPDVEILSENSVKLSWDSEQIANATVSKDNNANENKLNGNKSNDNLQNEAKANGNNQNDPKSNDKQRDADKRNDNKLDSSKSNNNQSNNNKLNEGTSNQDKSNEKSQQIYDVEKKENQEDWQKVQQVPLSKDSIQIDDLKDSSSCEFRLVPAESVTNEQNGQIENEQETFTVHDINQWLNSLHVSPSSPTTVNVNISPEAFQQFSSYQVEFTRADQPDQWQKIADVTENVPELTIDKLKHETDYKFRFTPVSAAAETNASQLSVVLDVKTPAKRKGRFEKEAEEKPKAPPPQFTFEQTDDCTVTVEAVLPKDQAANFDDVFEIYCKKDNDQGDWMKVASIDKDHLTAKIENLEENTPYTFKIDNITSPNQDNKPETIHQFQIETKSTGPKFNPSVFLEKIEASLENVVNGVMQAAAGHKIVNEPVNVSLNEVIKEVFRDENLTVNEQDGFDALSLANDLQLYRGPKQMMLNELEGEETVDVSKHYGEIIIHNYRHAQQTLGSVIVKEENGNTRVGNIDGDIIIRNVVSDVLLINEHTRHQLSMNIVGQAFLKGVQGTLIASKFKGIIVVKTVNIP